MNKIELAVADIKTKLSKIKEVFAVILYGSVARGDYSLRHSDIDVLIILEEKKAKLKADKAIAEISIANRVKIHPEYQTKNISQEDQTLLCKMLEEGKILFCRGLWFMNMKQLGLDTFRLYRFDTLNANKINRVILSRALHGRNKDYKGLIDDISIIDSGKGGLLVKKDSFKDVEDLLNKLNIKYKIKKTVYG